MMRTCILIAAAAAALYGQVTYERLLRTADEPHNWLT